MLIKQFQESYKLVVTRIINHLADSITAEGILHRMNVLAKITRQKGSTARELNAASLCTDGNARTHDKTIFNKR